MTLATTLAVEQEAAARTLERDPTEWAATERSLERVASKASVVSEKELYGLAEGNEERLLPFHVSESPAEESAMADQNDLDGYSMTYEEPVSPMGARPPALESTVVSEGARNYVIPGWREHYTKPGTFFPELSTVPHTAPGRWRH